MDRIVRIGMAALTLLTFGCLQSKADGFDVSLNTSSLSGPQILAFGFVDGDGVANNSVTLSSFDFGGGSALGSPDYLGTSGVSGDLSGTVSMNDSGLTALFSQEFNPGVSLSFVLNSTDVFAGVAPDALAMYVCDTSFNCYSDDAIRGDLLELDLTGGAIALSNFTLNGASAQGLPAPVVTASTVSATTPEPGSALSLLLGLVLLSLTVKKSARLGARTAL
jgi:hypothetical protein